MWPKVPLDQLGYVSRGKSRHRPRNDESLYGGEYPFIQTADVKAADLWITSHTQTYNEKGLAQSKLWPIGTLCITIAANIADTAILSYPACFPDSIIGFVADDEKCDVRFVKYYFNIVQEQMRMVSQGATQDNLNQDKLLSFGMPCPPIEVQRKIGAVLSTYSALIETNRRRIALLEESARLLYREWFVDSIVSRASDENSGNGLPNGWQLLPLSALAAINSSSLGSKPTLSEIQYIDIAAVEKGTVRKGVTIPLEAAPGRARRLVQHGDVIWSCVRPNRQSYALMWAPDENVVVSTGFAVLSAINVPFSYLYLATTTDDFTAYLEGRATGAAYPAVTGKDFESAPMVLPPASILEHFHDCCVPVFEQIDVLQRQNMQLTQARDELIPKLMSGELRL